MIGGLRVNLLFPLSSVVTCNHPATVENTTLITPVQAEYDYGTSITYECNLAYNLTAGDLIRTCQADATWSGDVPVCLGE